MMNAEQLVISIAARHLSVDEAQVSLSMKLGDLADWTSITHVSILADVMDRAMINIDVFSDELISLEGIANILKKKHGEDRLY